MSGPALLSVEGLTLRFRSGGRSVPALDGVSFALRRGETLGLVGPSGSGKSTLARVLLRLAEPDTGTIRFQGEDWLALRGARLRQRRGAMQMVFQDALSAFNPRATVAGVLDDPLRIHGTAGSGGRETRVVELLERVGLTAAMGARRVHELSGGQRQRLALARALAPKPSLIVLDEAVSALDVSVRARILALIADLQRSEGLALLFISHDLAVVRVIAHRLAILEAGRIVETGPTEAVIADPGTPVGRALVAAVPRLGR